MSTQPTSTEAPAADPPKPGSTLVRRSLRSFTILLVFGGLFSVALIGSAYIQSKLTHVEDVPNPPSEPIDEVRALRAKPPGPVELLSRGDIALRHYRTADAMSYYKDLLASGATRTPQLQYRLGLCSESIGHLEDAVTAYREVIDATDSRSLSTAAHLCTARCVLRLNRPAEARRLLYPFLLDEARHQDLPQAFAIDTHYLVALSLAQEIADADPKGTGVDDRLSVSTIPLAPVYYLDEIGIEKPGRAASAHVAIPAPLRIKKRSDNEPAIILEVDSKGQLAKDVLDQMIVESGLKTEWTVKANRTVADRTLRLHLHDWELNDVLELVADQLGVACLIDDTTVRFSATEEVKGEQWKSLRRDMTQRAMLTAIRAEPSHPYAATMFLELGNIEAARKRWSDAIFWYRRLTKDAISSPLVTPAYYNMARTHLSNNDLAEARKSFFHVVDQSPGSELAMRASVHIGQISLFEDNAPQAIGHLRRAQSMAVGSPNHPLTTLALAAAYLHDGNASAARETLTKHRARLLEESFRPTASFLDSYAQYRLVKDAKGALGAAREVKELIDTLWLTRDETVLGAQGDWLIAQAYSDLGYWDECERVLRTAQARARGPFQACVDCSLADVMAKNNKRPEAAKILAKWALADTPYQSRCRFQLAQIDLAEGRFRECADACRKLWSEKSYADSSALLRLWGTALEGTGELTKAAQCYAGKAPD